MIVQMGISGNAEGRLDGKDTGQRKASGKEAGSNSLTCQLKKSLNLHTGGPKNWSTGKKKNNLVQVLTLLWTGTCFVESFVK